MALETERSPARLSGLRWPSGVRHLRDLFARLLALFVRLGERLGPRIGALVVALLRPLARPFMPEGRYASVGAEIARWADRVKSVTRFKSIYWRILTANVVGLIVMLIGIVVVSQHQAWLIEAKSESLEAQGHIIAAAIAANVSSDHRGVTFPDPDKILETAPGASLPPVGTDFEEFDFMIRPERVAPFLHRMTQPTETRARIYDADLTMIYDNEAIGGRPPRRTKASEIAEKQPTVQDFWTRLDSLFVPSNLPVYKEIGTANGGAYPEVREALNGKVGPMLRVTERGRHIVSVAVPIRRMDKVIGVLLLATKESDIDRILRRERHMITWVFAIALIATALSAFFLARTIGEPMRRLAEAAINVKRNMHARTEVPAFSERHDEIGHMARAFKDMTDSLYRRIELSEKFAADVAHELKNPVTAVRSAAETLGYVKSEADRSELLQNMQNDLNRLNKLISDISNFSRLDAEMTLQEAERVDIATVLEQLATAFNDMHRREDGAKPVRIEIPPSARPLIVLGHEMRLGQVITNLIDNAISFLPEDGTVVVSCVKSGSKVEILVEDNGPGIPADKLETIFGRFYTDRPDSERVRGKNSGLGLSISREIVEAHGGRIWAENVIRPDGSVGGARFHVRLPAAGPDKGSSRLVRPR